MAIEISKRGTQLDSDNYLRAPCHRQGNREKISEKLEAKGQSTKVPPVGDLSQQSGTYPFNRRSVKMLKCTSVSWKGICANRRASHAPRRGKTGPVSNLLLVARNLFDISARLTHGHKMVSAKCFMRLYKENNFCLQKYFLF